MYYNLGFLYITYNVLLTPDFFKNKYIEILNLSLKMHFSLKMFEEHLGEKIRHFPCRAFA